MPSTVTATVTSQLTGVQTFTGDQISSADNTTTVNGLNESNAYTASTAVPVTKLTAFTVTLSSGTGSIDFSALPGLTADETIVGTGLKPQAIKFRAKSTNANAITIAEGASNGHALLGASFTFKLLAGQTALFDLKEAAPDVASGDRIIDITGTGSQQLEVTVVLG